MNKWLVLGRETELLSYPVNLPWSFGRDAGAQWGLGNAAGPLQSIARSSVLGGSRGNSVALRRERAGGQGAVVRLSRPCGRWLLPHVL